MKILITGADGYIGFPLTLHLLSRGHEVVGVDNLSRRRRVREVDAWTATPIADPFVRDWEIKKLYPKHTQRLMDLLDYSEVLYVFKKHKPDVCIHLGEIPSAPYSMIDREHCNETMKNNIEGTNNILYAIHDETPDCHLVKIGTMGEYGTPNVDIPEGFFEIDYRGREDSLPFPRQAGSWYHQTKVHDSHNIMFASKIWGLRSTDIMQGVVHGVRTSEMINDNLLTRFDFDEIWGTALNRFCAQAIIGHPLTVYGKGGQTRGYIALVDSIQCLTLAVENPPEEGIYRVFNQFDETYSVNELAERVMKTAQGLGLNAKIQHIPNPRVEAEEHHYNPDHSSLYDLGFKPTHSLEQELKITLSELMRWRDRIEAKKERIMPKVNWRD